MNHRARSLPSMKLATCITLLLACVPSARADVLPPTQDTSSSSGKLTLVNGKAATLAVTGVRRSYVYFDLDNLPGDVLPADIAQARLRIYFPSAVKPGDLTVHTVTPGAALWSESAAVAAAEPAIDATPLATILKASVVAKKFIEIDVTSTVRAWRAGTLANFGFAFKATGTTSVSLGAKEGPGSGYPCVLEVEIDRETGDGSIGSGQLADLSVTAAKLALGAALSNLADGSIAPEKLTTSSLTIAAGTGLTGGGPVSLGGTLTLGLGANLTLAGSTTGTFVGDGSGLTNINIASLADGSVANGKLANPTITITAGGGLSGGGEVALGGAVTLSLGSDLTLSGTTTLPAGTATVAPVRVQQGVNLTTPVFGAVEFDGTNLFLTNNSPSPTRKTIAFTDSPITAAQIAPGTIGAAQLASGLTLGGTTTGAFSGSLTGNAATATTAGSATNFTGSLAGNVTGTQGATVVASVGGVTAANVAAGANLANAATNANTASTIVKRDGSGNFTTGTITLSGNLVLPTTSATAGSILRGSTLMMHSFGSDNFFAAANAGNFTLTGTGNTAIGVNALAAHVDGFANTAVGGYVLASNTSGERNAALGYKALNANLTGGGNVAIGEYAIWKNTSGMRNVAIGSGALFDNLTGSDNIAIGKDAGANTTGSGNIDIGHGGVAGEANIIRIGSGQTDTYLAGIIHGNGSALTGITATSLTANSVGTGQLASNLTLNGTTVGTFSGNVTGNVSGSAASFTGSLAGNVIGTQGATVVATVGGVTAANVASGANLANAATNANTASALVKRDASGNFTAGTITVGGLTDTGNLTLPTTAAGGSAGVIMQNSTRLFHTFGPSNFFAGQDAGNFTLTGSGNTAVGGQALKAHTTGFASTAVGGFALFSNTTGDRNTANGYSALSANVGGSFNTAMGEYASAGNVDGLRNVAVGSGALFANTSGSDNIAIGKGAGGSTTGSGNILIGHGGVASESNIVHIGSSQSDTYLAGVVHGNGSQITGLAAANVTGRLTSSQTGAVFCRYRNDSGQSIPNSASTTITSWTSVSDASAAFNGATGAFQAPFAGNYEVRAYLLLQNVSTQARLELYKNGVFYSSLDFQNYSVTEPYAPVRGTDVVPLATGETLSIKVFQTSGSARSLFADGAYNYISVLRVAD